MPRRQSRQPAKAAPPAFADVERRILERLDLRAEFAALGVEIVGSTPGPKGYVECHAMGRDDRTPSAGVNLETGRYKDFGGDGESLSFWDFCAAHGNFANWRAAREHFAAKTGEALPAPPGKGKSDKHRAKTPAEQLHWLTWNAAQVALWARHKPGVTVEAVELAGGRLAKYADRYVVVCLPAWGKELLDADPTGYVVWNISGKSLPVYSKGSASPTKNVKMKTVAGSQSGLMNRFALARLAQARLAATTAKESLTVWKVEGPSDAMALQARIPAELRDIHLVVTNSGGANEHPTAAIAELFDGQRVFVLHDADRAGEEGAARHWLPGLAPHAAELRHVRLPYEVVPDHGKDLRDWLNDGGTYDALLAMAEAAPIYLLPPEKKSPEKKKRAAQGTHAQAETEEDEKATTDDTDSTDEGGEGGATSAETQPAEPEQAAAAADDGPEPLSNSTCRYDDDGREHVKPLPMTAVLAAVYERTGNWPRRVGPAIFAHDENRPDSPIDWLDSAPSAFGWLSSKCGLLEWRRGPGCVTKEETFWELKRTAAEYEAVEELPHFPPIAKHYYACSMPEPGDGAALGKLVQFFSPDSDADYNLILAMFATAFWGGRGGARPCFVITASEGRGIGKTKLSDVLSQLVGGHVEISQSDEAAIIRQRLLSPEGLNKRLARLDNVKSLRFSWADLESIITTPKISGKRMYVGEGSRPNTLTWVITLNGVALSTDMAQRSIVIKLRKPDRRRHWEQEVTQHVEEHRTAIVADIRHFLELPSKPIEKHTRWAAWEGDVLAKLPDAEALLQVIGDRSTAADADADEALTIEEFFCEQLDALEYRPEVDQVLIPSNVAANWYGQATHEKRPISHACRILHQAAGEGKFTRLSSYRSKAFRGFCWNREPEPGDNRDNYGFGDPRTKGLPVHTDILSRIQSLKHRF